MTFFKDYGIIPPPLKTLEIIVGEAGKPTFARAVSDTLWKSFFSFVLSFIPAFIFAALSHIFKPLKYLFEPFITICRVMPTMALVVILLLVFGSRELPAAVAFLVVFPLVYENIYAAFGNVDKNLTVMAKSFKVPRMRQITGIYAPAVLPYLFSSVIAGFGLNIKVVISAEVMGLPSFSIGYLIRSAQQGFDFSLSFAWLVVAVSLSFVCEAVLKLIGRFCMPFQYPDFGIAKGFLTKTGKIIKSIFAKPK